MTDKNFTNSQSPRASRASTEDPLAYTKGEVEFEVGSTGRVSPKNEGAERLFDKSGNFWNSRARQQYVAAGGEEQPVSPVGPEHLRERRVEARERLLDIRGALAYPVVLARTFRIGACRRRPSPSDRECVPAICPPSGSGKRLRRILIQNGGSLTRVGRGRKPPHASLLE
jgi:hypothetical protein